MGTRRHPSSLESGELGTSCIGAALVATGAFLPWIADRTCSHSNLSLWSLPISRWIVLSLLIVIAGATASQAFGLFTQFARGLTAMASLVLLLAPLAGIVALELLALWAYPQFLPATWRRFLPGAVPLTGLWLSTLGAALLVLSAAGGAPWLIERLRGLGGGLRRHQTSDLAVVLLIVALPLLVVGRTSSWINATSPAGRWSVPGYAIPWLGVITLIALIAIAVLTAVGTVRMHPGVAAILIVVGWAITFAAAVVLIPAAVAPAYHVPTSLHTDLARWTSRLQTLVGSSCQMSALGSSQTIAVRLGSGLLMTYVGGAVVALAGILALRDTRRVLP